MTTIETIRQQVEIWEAFKNMPDEAVIRADLAAVYLGISKKTLARLRQNGGGPPYIQSNDDESTARNQIVNYVMSKLREYRNSKEVTSSMNAAQTRGLAFATTADLLEERPYVQSESGTIFGHLQTVSDEAFVALLCSDNSAKIEWLSLPEVLTKNWTSDEARKPFFDAYAVAAGWKDFDEKLIKTVGIEVDNRTVKRL